MEREDGVEEVEDLEFCCWGGCGFVEHGGEEVKVNN